MGFYAGPLSLSAVKTKEKIKTIDEAEEVEAVVEKVAPPAKKDSNFISWLKEKFAIKK